jgi:hypothetical protein
MGAVGSMGAVDQLLSTVGFAPCFPVIDLKATLDHYQRLGFDVMDCSGEDRWAWARLGAAEIHFFVKGDHDPARTAAAADLTVMDCDALAARWSAAGVPGTSDPYDTPYGMREAVHVDPDNNLIRIVTPLSSS